MYSDRLSLHGSLKYASYSMPVSHWKKAGRKKHSTLRYSKLLDRLDTDVKVNCFYLLVLIFKMPFTPIYITFLL